MIFDNNNATLDTNNVKYEGKISRIFFFFE